MKYSCASESLSPISGVSVGLPSAGWVVVGYPDIIQIAAESPLDKSSATQSYLSSCHPWYAVELASMRNRTSKLYETMISLTFICFSESDMPGTFSSATV